MFKKPNMSKGEIAEMKLSKTLHSQYTPVLISPLLLRSYGSGQVDIAYVSDSLLTLVEVKSSDMGIQNLYRTQIHKLYNSVRLLESALGIPVELKVQKYQY